MANPRTAAGSWKSISMPPLSFFHKTPAVIESDFSGVIAGGTLDGTGYIIGQEVFGVSPFEGPHGVYALLSSIC